jgi:lipid A 3-O-deacylase
MKGTMAMAGTLIIIWLSPVWGQSGEPESKPSPTPKIIWTDGIGSGFHKGTFHAVGTVGAGLGFRKPFNTEEVHDFGLASVNLGWVFTDLIASDKWYRGNFELLIKLFGGGQFKPNDRYFVGLTPLIRYTFATRSRWMPFVDAGAGVSATNIEGPDLTGTFQFNLQMDAGTDYFISDRAALTAQCGWLHFSNAGTRQPNHGTNTLMFEVGASLFF